MVLSHALPCITVGGGIHKKSSILEQILLLWHKIRCFAKEMKRFDEIWPSYLTFEILKIPIISASLALVLSFDRSLDRSATTLNFDPIMGIFKISNSRYEGQIDGNHLLSIENSLKISSNIEICSKILVSINFTNLYSTGARAF